jgi:structural maintenance of chromosomes protein 6
VEKKRSTAKLTQEIQNMEKALKDREKRQGATTEQIMTELAVRKRTVTEALSATNDLANLVRVS